jgi:hypothetical protein
MDDEADFKGDFSRIIIVETQIKIFRWVLGGFCVAMLTISGSLTNWIYAQGSNVNVLQNELNTQKLIIRTHEQKIDRSSSNAVKMGQGIQANNIHLQHIKSTVKEIVTLLKNQK